MVSVTGRWAESGRIREVVTTVDFKKDSGEDVADDECRDGDRLGERDGDNIVDCGAYTGNER